MPAAPRYMKKAEVLVRATLRGFGLPASFLVHVAGGLALQEPSISEDITPYLVL